MSFNHETSGWKMFEDTVEALETVGFTVEVVEVERDLLHRRPSPWRGMQGLRRATYPREGTVYVLEEYLAVDDGDCDGSSIVRAIGYEEGHRPTLYREVLEGGHLSYPGVPVDADGYGPYYFRWCINTGEFTDLAFDSDAPPDEEDELEEASTVASG